MAVEVLGRPAYYIVPDLKLPIEEKTARRISLSEAMDILFAKHEAFLAENPGLEAAVGPPGAAYSSLFAYNALTLLSGAAIEVDGGFLVMRIITTSKESESDLHVSSSKEQIGFLRSR